MQNRFKFRVWDAEEDRYASDEDICFDTGGSCDNVYDLVVVDDQFYIYEQCTGLRDKNGKLIYEGDVVEVPVLYNGIPTGKKQRCKVYYKHGAFNIYAVKSKYLKVIGNIHENSELLEGQSYDNNQN